MNELILNILQEFKLKIAIIYLKKKNTAATCCLMLDKFCPAKMYSFIHSIINIFSFLKDGIFSGSWLLFSFLNLIIKYITYFVG